MDGAAKPSAEAARPGFWRRLRARLRFGLGGLVLFVLFLASLAAVWVRWEPWACVGPYYKALQYSPDPVDFGSVYKQLPKPILRIDRIHTENLSALEEVVLVANDGTWFLTRDHEHMIRCRDANDGSNMLSPFSEFSNVIKVSPNGGSFIVELSSLNRKELYSTKDQRFLARFTEYSCFSRDGSKLLSIKDDQLNVLDTSTGASLGHYRPFGQFDPEKEGQAAVDSPEWASHAGEILQSIYMGLDQPLGDHLVVLHRKRTFILFDFCQGKTIATLKEGAAARSVESTYILPDESRCYLLGERLMGWDIARNEMLFDVNLPCNYVVEESYLDPDRFLVSSANSWALVDSTSGSVLFRWPDSLFVNFINSDEMVAEPNSTAEDKTPQLWRRRHPEWWWGHFYRPEVWLAIVIGALWLWRVVRAVRSPCSP